MTNLSHLAWFLGPKAENAAYLEDLLTLVIRDYVHWRRNYFPSDATLVSRKVQRDLQDEHDALEQRVGEMLKDLRRNFPFYSPRYIAHQLSDVTLPGIVGYLAGLLYNPNNVTTEAAPVTVDWEIDACGRIMSMLGYTPPPDLPGEGEDIKGYYARAAKREFGWAHITSGGTVANIEALWIARNVRYFPLAVREAAIARNIEVHVKRSPSQSEKVDIRSLTAREVLLLKPNESVYLLARFFDAVRRASGLGAADSKETERLAWNYLNDTKFGPAKGLTAAFAEHPPVLFVSGAAHYSIGKAADILGIGRANVESVKLDSNFRINIHDLEVKIRAALAVGRVPLAVVGIAGTTEEGAVDPLHEIVDLRRQLEEDGSGSFWLHVDAAWGGYVRSVFYMHPDDSMRTISAKLYDREVGLPLYEGDLLAWNRDLQRFLRERVCIVRSDDDGAATAPEPAEDRDTVSAGSSADTAATVRRLEDVIQILSRAAASDNVSKYVDALERIREFATFLEPVTISDLTFTLDDRMKIVNRFVGESLGFRQGRYEKRVPVTWGSTDVCSAFVALPQADSVTIDPHKLGYLPYPCGVVAFKNDRVRHLVVQRAPYITSADHSGVIHVPPRRAEAADEHFDKPTVLVDAFGPFILEGSKPGAAAAALWLSTQTIPLTREGHGLIIRASLLAAREVYEWLSRWTRILDANRIDSAYEFVPLTSQAPDLNIVNFVVKPRSTFSLRKMNALTDAVYKDFAIQTELGQREHSYSQDFFLSHTRFEPPTYPSETLHSFFRRTGLQNTNDQYVHEGLSVLRATVMSPYMHPMREGTGQNLAYEFVRELSKTAAAAIKRVV